MTPSRILALTALTLFTIGCGGDDDTGDGDANGDAPAAADANDANDANDDSSNDDDANDDAPVAGEADQPADDAPTGATGATESISGGTGTLTIDLPDGRTETRDVDCSIYTDQFETTFEYSDILDDDQSVSLYYRVEGDAPTDVTFTFQDPELGGLGAFNVATASNASISGPTLSVDLDTLIVGSTDDAGNPVTAGVNVTGTCAP